LEGVDTVVADHGVVVGALGNSMSAGQQTPQCRVVLLGASNLVRGISTVVETARQAWEEPLDIVAALGHGRSYGRESSVILRSLPGILSCGIWKSLESHPNIPTSALLTDIGNDILYGHSVDQTTDWIELCLKRLSRVTDRVVITELPLESSARMKKWKFFALRTIFFPSCRVRYEDAIVRARELNDRVVELANKYNVETIRPLETWYGFDPIHIKTRVFPAVWREILGKLHFDSKNNNYHASLRRWLLLRSLRPEQRRLFGIVQQSKQPVYTFADGTRVSFY